MSQNRFETKNGCPLPVDMFALALRVVVELECLRVPHVALVGQLVGYEVQCYSVSPFWTTSVALITTTARTRVTNVKYGCEGYIFFIDLWKKFR